jgi:hypothetical protein
VFNELRKALRDPFTCGIALAKFAAVGVVREVSGATQEFSAAPGGAAASYSVAPLAVQSQPRSSSRSRHISKRSCSTTGTGSTGAGHSGSGNQRTGHPATQLATPIGRLDFLCHDTETDALVVVELKRGKPSDRVVGQAARYIGWVRQHIARTDQRVEGIIVAHEQGLQLAVRSLGRRGPVGPYVPDRLCTVAAPSRRRQLINAAAPLRPRPCNLGPRVRRCSGLWDWDPDGSDRLGLLRCPAG